MMISRNECCECEHCGNCGRCDKRVLVCDDCGGEDNIYYNEYGEHLCYDCLYSMIEKEVFGKTYETFDERVFDIIHKLGENIAKTNTDEWTDFLTAETFSDDEILNYLKKCFNGNLLDDLIEMFGYQNWRAVRDY